MARLPRIVIPGIPHHATQRGNGRAQTFFEDGDYALYLDLLADAAARAHVQVWAYCLMPNHVHLILIPSLSPDYAEETLRAAMLWGRSAEVFAYHEDADPISPNDFR